jgi:hypothetical protein
MSAISITKILHSPVDKLSPVKAQPFLDALRKKFSPEVTDATVKYLFTDFSKNPNVSYNEGLEKFQKRLMEAIGSNEDISGADQVYIANITQNVALGHLKITQ